MYVWGNGGSFFIPINIAAAKQHGRAHYILPGQLTPCILEDSPGHLIADQRRSTGTLSFCHGQQACQSTSIQCSLPCPAIFLHTASAGQARQRLSHSTKQELSRHQESMWRIWPVCMCLPWSTRLPARCSMPPPQTTTRHGGQPDNAYPDHRLCILTPLLMCFVPKPPGFQRKVLPCHWTQTAHLDPGCALRLLPTHRGIAEAVGKNAGVPTEGISLEDAYAKEIWPAWVTSLYVLNNRAASTKAQKLLGWGDFKSMEMLSDISDGSYASKA